MTDFDPKAITFSEIENEQYAYIESKPEGLAFKDRYNHASGSIEIDLNSIVATHLLRKVIFERNEVYLRHANKLSSVIAFANFLGYSVARPKNNRVRIKLLPTVTKTYSKFEEIGLLKDVSLLAMETINIIAGQVIFIDCIIGNKLESVLTIPSNKPDLFRFIDQDVSHDLRLFLSRDGIRTELSFTEHIRDLLNDKYVVITNPYSSIDIMFLNKPDSEFAYSSGDVLVLEYIEAVETEYLLDHANVTLFDGTFYPEGNAPGANDTQTLTSYQPFEDILSIVINAPLYFESQGFIKGREDFRKNLLITSGGTLIDTNGRDVSPMEVELTYLKGDKTLLTNTEKTNYITKLNSFTNYGVWLKTIIEPIEVNYRLVIKLKSYIGVDISNVSNDITEIFSYTHKDNFAPVAANRIARRELKLEHVLNLDQIEHEINRIQNPDQSAPVQICRVELYLKNWQAETDYNRGDFIKLDPEDTVIYECVRGGGSLEELPDFNNNINGLTIEGLQLWEADTEYTVGDYVKSNVNLPYIFKCTATGLSGSFEPSWTLSNAENAITLDNQVTWKAYLPLDVPDFLIWRCRDINIRSLDIAWNEFIDLSYGDNIVWL